MFKIFHRILPAEKKGRKVFIVTDDYLVKVKRSAIITKEFKICVNTNLESIAHFQIGRRIADPPLYMMCSDSIKSLDFTLQKFAAQHNRWFANCKAIRTVTYGGPFWYLSLKRQ